MMCWMNFWTTTYNSIYLFLLTDKGSSMLAFCMRHPDALFDMVGGCGVGIQCWRSVCDCPELSIPAVTNLSLAYQSLSVTALTNPKCSPAEPHVPLWMGLNYTCHCGWGWVAKALVR